MRRDAPAPGRQRQPTPADGRRRPGEDRYAAAPPSAAAPAIAGAPPALASPRSGSPKALRSPAPSPPGSPRASPRPRLGAATLLGSLPGSPPGSPRAAVARRLVSSPGAPQPASTGERLVPGYAESLKRTIWGLEEDVGTYVRGQLARSDIAARRMWRLRTWLLAQWLFTSWFDLILGARRRRSLLRLEGEQQDDLASLVRLQHLERFTMSHDRAQWFARNRQRRLAIRLFLSWKLTAMLVRTYRWHDAEVEKHRGQARSAQRQLRDLADLQLRAAGRAVYTRRRRGDLRYFVAAWRFSVRAIRAHRRHMATEQETREDVHRDVIGSVEGLVGRMCRARDEILLKRILNALLVEAHQSLRRQRDNLRYHAELHDRKLRGQQRELHQRAVQKTYELMNREASQHHMGLAVRAWREVLHRSRYMEAADRFRDESTVMRDRHAFEMGRVLARNESARGRIATLAASVHSRLDRVVSQHLVFAAWSRLPLSRPKMVTKLVEDTTREVRLEGIVRVKQMSYMQCQVHRKKVLTEFFEHWCKVLLHKDMNNELIRVTAEAELKITETVLRSRARLDRVHDTFTYFLERDMERRRYGILLPVWWAGVRIQVAEEQTHHVRKRLEEMRSHVSTRDSHISRYLNRHFSRLRDRLVMMRCFWAMLIPREEERVSRPFRARIAERSQEHAKEIPQTKQEGRAHSIKLVAQAMELRERQFEKDARTMLMAAWLSQADWLAQLRATDGRWKRQVQFMTSRRRHADALLDRYIAWFEQCLNTFTLLRLLQEWRVATVCAVAGRMCRTLYKDLGGVLNGAKNTAVDERVRSAGRAALMLSRKTNWQVTSAHFFVWYRWVLRVKYFREKEIIRWTVANEMEAKRSGSLSGVQPGSRATPARPTGQLCGRWLEATEVLGPGSAALLLLQVFFAWHSEAKLARVVSNPAIGAHASFPEQLRRDLQAKTNIEIAVKTMVESSKVVGPSSVLKARAQVYRRELRESGHPALEDFKAMDAESLEKAAFEDVEQQEPDDAPRADPGHLKQPTRSVRVELALETVRDPEGSHPRSPKRLMEI